MAQIILNTGEVLEVTYNQAAKVYQILIGNKEPDGDEQAEFITTVADVKFPVRKSSTISSHTGLPDPELHRIMDTQYSTGYAKYAAIRDYLKGSNRV